MKGMMILTLHVWRLEKQGQSRHLRAPMGHNTYRLHHKLSEATVLFSEKKKRLCSTGITEADDITSMCFVNEEKGLLPASG